MRPSSLGGGRILRRTLSVRLSVCPSVPLADVLCLHLHRLTSEHPKYKNFGFFAYGPASRMYFSARAEGRISYGYLGRTNSCYIIIFISVRFLVKIYRVTTAITIPSIDNTSYKVSTFNRFLIAVVRLFCAAT